MTRVHKVMAAVIIAEREEREKRKEIQITIPSYDGGTHAKVTCTLPECFENEDDVMLQMIPPREGCINSVSTNIFMTPFIVSYASELGRSCNSKS